MRRMAMVVTAAVASAVVAGPALAASGTFLDDDGNVHEGMIEAIAADGVTLGCNPPANDLYCPSQPVTREQMAAFLVRALGLPSSSTDHFADDDGSVFEADINALASAGITAGCNPPANTAYCPGGTVTRGEMAAFLKRAFHYGTDSTDWFEDDDDSVFEADIQAIRRAGVTKGCNPPDNTRYCPDGPVERDQMASFLGRALELAPVDPSGGGGGGGEDPGVDGEETWSCTWEAANERRLCHGDINVEDGDEYWFCEAFHDDTYLRCGGAIEPGNDNGHGWGCEWWTEGYESWECGRLDSDYWIDDWSCQDAGPGIVECRGNVTGDGAQEVWLCGYDRDSWSCSGDVNGERPGEETWYCLLGPTIHDQQCAGDAAWRKPALNMVIELYARPDEPW